MTLVSDGRAITLDTPRDTMRAFVLSLCLTMIAACGIGTYGDTGSPAPGQWWPWVCPDGGAPAGDAGCLPARPADARAHAWCVDGGDVECD
jgi:hypothetical protein